MLDALLGVAPRGRLCGLKTANAGRRLLFRDVTAALEARPGAAWAESVGEGLEAARAEVARGEADAILVTGSFHTVGEALVALDIATPGQPYERPAPEVPAVAGGAPR
jgi:folylpolyglutamate synthase/dihydropteroate synthase